MDRIDQNSSVERTRVFWGELCHHGYEPVEPMPALRPFFSENGRCAKQGEEMPIVVSDFSQQIEMDQERPYNLFVKVAHHSGSTEAWNNVNVSTI